MTSTWKTTLMTVALAFTLAANLAVHAQEAGDPQPQAKPDKLEEIQKQLNEFNKTLILKFDELNKSLAKDFAGVSQDIDKLQKDVKQLQDDKFDQDLKLADMEMKIKDLEDSLQITLGEMKALKIKMNDVKLYPPHKAHSPPAANVSRIVLVNNTSEEILFIINGQARRVAPFGTQNLEAFPAGTVSYEVLSQTFGSLRKNTTTLNANETFTIRVG